VTALAEPAGRDHPITVDLFRMNTMARFKQAPGTPPLLPAPPWLVGAMIGVTIMTMAGTAMSLGAGLALSRTGAGTK
jgi:hypothetical protein